jgi:hypothetical protein
MTEYFRWWVFDEQIGGNRLTAQHLTREEARRLHPHAVPDVSSRQFREEELFADTLPPD